MKFFKNVGDLVRNVSEVNDWAGIMEKNQIVWPLIKVGNLTNRFSQYTKFRAENVLPHVHFGEVSKKKI